MTDKEIRLKPCPFCGGKAELVRGMWEVWVDCDACHASSGMESEINESTAVANWNRRVKAVKEGEL